MAPYRLSNNFFIMAIGAFGLAALAAAGIYMLPGNAEKRKQPQPQILFNKHVQAKDIRRTLY